MFNNCARVYQKAENLNQKKMKTIYDLPIDLLREIAYQLCRFSCTHAPTFYKSTTYLLFFCKFRPCVYIVDTCMLCKPICCIHNEAEANIYRLMYKRRNKYSKHIFLHGDELKLKIYLNTLQIITTCCNGNGIKVRLFEQTEHKN